MTEERKQRLDEEAVLLLNKGKKGLLRLIFGRTGVVIALLAAQAGLLFWGFFRLGKYMFYSGSMLLALAVVLVVYMGVVSVLEYWKKRRDTDE